MNVIEIPTVADMHLHLRQGEMFANVAPISANYCSTILAMPNTDPPIISNDDVDNYRSSIKRYMPNTEVLIAAYLTPETTPEMVQVSNADAYKLYPKNATTKSDRGISRELLIHPTVHLCDPIWTIRQRNKILSLHGELPESEFHFCEHDFLHFVTFLLDNFPGLRIVLEHISTAEQVQFVRQNHLRRIAATITYHHLMLTTTDILGPKLYPHNFCRPPAKTNTDRLALIEAATSGEPCFFFGSDSAPHLIGDKESDVCCAGCFTAPMAIEGLIDIFEQRDRIKHLPNFLSNFGRQFYGLKPVDSKIHYVHSPWIIPNEISGVRPFMAGKTMKYSRR